MHKINMMKREYTVNARIQNWIIRDTVTISIAVGLMYQKYKFNLIFCIIIVIPLLYLINNSLWRFSVSNSLYDAVYF
jgi:hypothetical protein